MPLNEMKFGELLDSIAAKSPTPGGGAVAAMTCALASSLGQMVVQYSIGKKSLASHDALHKQALATLQQISHRALELADADAAAYARMNELWKLKEDDPRRQRDLPAAVAGAIEPPRRMLDDSLQLLRVVSDLLGKTNASLNSDLAIAALLADAAVRAAAWNVRINLPLLDDTHHREELTKTVSSALDESHTISAHIEQACIGK